MTQSLVQQAIADLQQGKMVVLLDPSSRENEGDVVCAAQSITAAKINFMLQHARGIICLAMSPEHCDRLNIPPMCVSNNAQYQTPFGVSFEAAHGVTTGVSAADRAHSIAVAAKLESGPSDIVMPGHVFPLRAQKQGLLARLGHTEGSVDLMALARLQQTAVICEVLNDDGSMARPNDLKQFAKKHDLTLLTIADVLAYRWQHEFFIKELASANLPVSDHADFTIKVFENTLDQAEHVALINPLAQHTPPLVRLHSECLTGDVFGSGRCDCGAQLAMAKQAIATHGGILLYLRQEGRGIGLANKIKAYALQQQQGLDTVSANETLGFAADMRDYKVAAQILRYLKVTRIRLMTNNPLKVSELSANGIEVVERYPLESIPTKDNLLYLKTKKYRLKHHLNAKELIC